MRTRSNRAGLTLAFTLLLATPSCVTAALWERPCHSSAHGWNEVEVAGRVLLTPLTLALDAVLITAYVGAHCGSACR